MLDDLPLSPPVPSWNDVYLKFTDADEAHEQLVAANLLTETQALLDVDGNLLIPAGYAPNNASIDTVGLIYKPTGATIETDMGEHPEMAALDGWHVNVRLKADQTAPSLDAYKVEPANPVRIWA